MLRKGKNFQTIIDGAQYPGLTFSAEGSREPAKFFDVISFDPRGVNNTAPTFSCFNDGIMSQTWEIEGESVGLLGSSNTSFEQIWSRSIALSQSCATHPSAFTHSNGKHIGKYINTSPVIRDMVQIIEKHGEWRERDVRNQLSSFGLTEKSEVYQSALRRGAWRKDNEKLLYWGLSYGTFVGQAFASMQPHRVGRMVLDGVTDTDDYTRNLGETDLLDTDNVLNALLTQCVEVAQGNCPWASNNTSTDLALQLEDLLSTLAVSPLPASGPRGPTTITESQLATMIFSNLFTPMDGFPTIAKLVSELLQGNGTSFAAYKEQSLPTNSQPLLKAGSWSQVPTTTAIVCGDGDSLYNLPRSSFKSRLARFRAQSPYFADVRAPFQLSCVHWPVRPVRFLPFKYVPRVLKNSELKARG
jgi:pimeloyl-ACP methyl ester carboxylesterase